MYKNTKQKFVPVISIDGNPLMPTIPAKARKLIRAGEATPFFKLGKIFCIRLTKQVENHTQPICIGIDPGSKREAFSVVSGSHNYLNIQNAAVSWVKDRMKQRAESRRSRRNRKTPCRPPRFNNRGSSKQVGRIPPSTSARWQLKLNIATKLVRLFPVAIIASEDITATTREGDKKWNASFSTIQCGKQYFEHGLKLLCNDVRFCSGFETSDYRKSLGLYKNKSDKLGEAFNIHCVDSYTIASMALGQTSLDNTNVYILNPIQLTRRQLHKLQFEKSDKNNRGTQQPRKRSGGTNSLGFIKGSIIKFGGQAKCSLNQGNYLVGGYDNNKLAICALDNQSSRVSRSINPNNINLLSFNKYQFRWAEDPQSKNR